MFFDTVDCQLHYGGNQGFETVVNMRGVEILTDVINKEGFGLDEGCQLYFTFNGLRFPSFSVGHAFTQTIVYTET